MYPNAKTVTAKDRMEIISRTVIGIPSFLYVGGRKSALRMEGQPLPFGNTFAGILHIYCIKA
jgi:hypothetical protein